MDTETMMLIEEYDALLWKAHLEVLGLDPWELYPFRPSTQPHWLNYEQWWQTWEEIECSEDPILDDFIKEMEYIESYIDELKHGHQAMYDDQTDEAIHQEIWEWQMLETRFSQLYRKV